MNSPRDCVLRNIIDDLCVAANNLEAAIFDSMYGDDPRGADERVLQALNVIEQAGDIFINLRLEMHETERKQAAVLAQSKQTSGSPRHIGGTRGERALMPRKYS
jgi:hypothetical protein